MKVFPRFFPFFVCFLLTFNITILNSTAQTYQNEKRQLVNSQRIIEVLSSDSLNGRSVFNNGKLKALRFLINEIKTHADTTLRLSLSKSFTRFNQINQVKLSMGNRHFILGEDFLPAGDIPDIETSVKLIHVDSLPIELTNSGILVQESVLKKRPYLLDSILTSWAILICIEVNQLHFSPSYQQNTKPIFFVKPNTVNSNDIIDVSIQSELISYPILNLIATRGDTSNRTPAFTFMAHYDHLGTINGNHIFNGANDNASGVAAAIELFLTASIKNRPVQLFLTDGEELGLLGAYTLLNNNDFYPIQFLINLDMVASGSGWGIVGAETDSLALKKLQSISYEENKTFFYRNNTPNSDHFPFLKSGIKGFYIYSNNGKQPYHSHQDDINSLTFSMFEETVSLLRAFFVNYDY